MPEWASDQREGTEGGDIMSSSIFWDCDVISENNVRQSIQNGPKFRTADFHVDPTRNDGALGIFPITLEIMTSFKT